MTKLPRAISKPIIPINIMMISVAVIGATSLPMYSGKPVISSGGYHPCHGFHSDILTHLDRNFNQILFLWNMWISTSQPLPAGCIASHTPKRFTETASFICSPKIHESRQNHYRQKAVNVIFAMMSFKKNIPAYTGKDRTKKIALPCLLLLYP